jgi:RNA polymerase sigma-70 factor, ECF subfamily
VETQAIKEPCLGADLVSRIRGGDRQAEVELVARYSRGITILIRREVGNTAIADDLYQETFWVVLRKIRQGDVREPAKLFGFVCSVARNLTINYFRQTLRLGSLTESEEATLFPPSAPNQLKELLQKENANLVRQVLKEMSNQRDTEVLFRFYIAEDKKEQICADLGLTGMHFNRVLHRARTRFRELYERAIQGSLTCRKNHAVPIEKGIYRHRSADMRNSS